MGQRIHNIRLGVITELGPDRNGRDNEPEEMRVQDYLSVDTPFETHEEAATFFLQQMAIMGKADGRILAVSLKAVAILKGDTIRRVK